MTRRPMAAGGKVAAVDDQAAWMAVDRAVAYALAGDRERMARSLALLEADALAALAVAFGDLKATAESPRRRRR
jgi:hypothetical protein